MRVGKQAMDQSDREYLDAQLKLLKNAIVRSHRQTTTVLKAQKIALELAYSTFFFNMGEANAQKWAKTISEKAEKASQMGPAVAKELESIFATGQRLAQSYGKNRSGRAAASAAKGPATQK